MAGKVALPIIVEIGFGAGPMDGTVTWTDVSEWVQRSKMIACNRSIDTTTMTPGDGRGSLRLKNDDGTFTFGENEAIRNRLPVRISAWIGTGTGHALTYDDAIGWYDLLGATYDDSQIGRVTLWTGLAEKWSAGVDGTRPVIDITLVDRWPRMRQRVLTGDRILQVCQALGASDLWPLTDPVGSTRARPVAGDWALLPQQGYGAASLLWSAAANPQSGLPATLATTGTGTMILRSTWDGGGSASPGLILSGECTWSTFVRCPDSTSSVTLILDVPNIGFRLFVNRDAAYIVSWWLSPSDYVPISSTTSWRHVAVTVSTSAPTVTLKVIVDGVEVYSRAEDAIFQPMREHTVEMTDSAEAAYVAVFDRALTLTEVQAIAAAGLDALGATGQAPDARAALAAALWPPTTLTTQGTCAATMSKQAIDGVSQADLLAACAVTEGGMLHISADGWPVLTARGARSDAALAATIPASVIETSAQWELDDTQIVNVATVERMALAEAASTVSRRNDSSVGLYGEVTKGIQGWWDTDAQAVARADTEVAMWADPSPRSKSFTVDLMTCGETIPAATLMGVDIGSRILLTGLPTQTPAQTAAGWYVDGIDDHITHESWKRTFTVTPALDFWVIDDATFGGLDDWPMG